MSLVTVPSCIVAPDSDQAAAPSQTIGDSGYAVQVAPAFAPAARGGSVRPVVAGVYPVWIQQTAANGAPLRRVLVQSPAAIYLAKGTGNHWSLVANSSAVAGTDQAWDVTYGDDAGDWLEYGGQPAGFLEALVLTLTNQVLDSTNPGGGVLKTLVTPAWARSMQLAALHTGVATTGATTVPTALTECDQNGNPIVGLLGAGYDTAGGTGGPNAWSTIAAPTMPIWQRVAAYGVLAAAAGSNAPTNAGQVPGPLPRAFRLRIGGQGGPNVTFGATARSDLYVRWSS